MRLSWLSGFCAHHRGRDAHGPACPTATIVQPPASAGAWRHPSLPRRSARKALCTCGPSGCSEPRAQKPCREAGRWPHGHGRPAAGRGWRDDPWRRYGGWGGIGALNFRQRGWLALRGRPGGGAGCAGDVAQVQAASVVGPGHTPRPRVQRASSGPAAGPAVEPLPSAGRVPWVLSCPLHPSLPPPMAAPVPRHRRRAWVATNAQIAP